ncbi:MAG TPA: hydantoinase/oxoprolinase family protein [Isosphaeraceae bacterium]|jgi:N-methylhydantoinase A|nr:hydantoinase/oxoprolinase family protein [Isosphaeraceae bacterium]
MAYLGVDIGGTFTDIVHLDDEGGVTATKTPSTPPDFERGFLEAVGKVAELRGEDPTDLLAGCEIVLHGTTVATNALVQLRGARVGLITTRGHRDILPVMRASGRAKGLPVDRLLHASEQYRPDPIVPPELIVEVDERIDAAGKVVVGLDEAQVEEAVRDLRQAGAESFAICFLWSVANPDHELRARERVRAAAPDAYVTCSHLASARPGEYERFAAAAINAFLGPETRGYLTRLKRDLVEGGLAGPLLVMQASGGVAPDELAADLPVLTIGSGPAAGVGASSVLAERRGEENVIATDMGGTSFDVALIAGGQPVRSQSVVENQYEFYLPRTDVRSIGSGGGSIIWRDPVSGVLRVGPESAGARPGPVAYGRGGERPTVTDANLLLGYLDPDNFLGGDLPLDVDGAERALAAVGEEVGLTAIEVALSARQIVNAQMADLIRQMTVERGMDPRDFALYGYGGAGGLHVAGYLAELGSVRGIVPLGTLSTTWSAYGCATSDVVHVFERAIQLSSPFEGGLLQEALAELEREAREELAQEGIDADRQDIERFVEMKYPLQIHRVEVPVDADDVARPGESLAQKFASIYDQLYGKGSAFEGAGSEIVGARVLGRGRLPQPRVKAAADGDAGEVPSREIVWASEDGPRRLDTRIVPAGRAAELSPIDGPAVVAAATTTILVPPGATATTDEAQNLVIDLDIRADN